MSSNLNNTSKARPPTPRGKAGREEATYTYLKKPVVNDEVNDKDHDDQRDLISSARHSSSSSARTTPRTSRPSSAVGGKVKSSRGGRGAGKSSEVGDEYRNDTMGAEEANVEKKGDREEQKNNYVHLNTDLAQKAKLGKSSLKMKSLKDIGISPTGNEGGRTHRPTSAAKGNKRKKGQTAAEAGVEPDESAKSPTNAELADVGYGLNNESVVHVEANRRTSEEEDEDEDASLIPLNLDSTATSLNMTSNTKQQFLSDVSEGRALCCDPNFDFTVRYRWKRTGELLSFDCSLGAISEYHSSLFAGCRVKITRGPYAGTEATIIGVREEALWRHDDTDLGAGPFNACKGDLAFDIQYGLQIVGYNELPGILRTEVVDGGGRRRRRSSGSGSAAMSKKNIKGNDQLVNTVDEGVNEDRGGVDTAQSETGGTPAKKGKGSRTAKSTKNKKKDTAQARAELLKKKQLRRRQKRAEDVIGSESDTDEDGTEDDEEEEDNKDPQTVAIEKRILLMKSDPSVVFSRIPRTSQLMYTRVRKPFFYPAPVTLPFPKTLRASLKQDEIENAEQQAQARRSVSASPPASFLAPFSGAVTRNNVPPNTANAGEAIPTIPFTVGSSSPTNEANSATCNIPKPLGAFPLEIAMYDVGPESLAEYGARIIATIDEEESAGGGGGVQHNSKRKKSHHEASSREQQQVASSAASSSFKKRLTAATNTAATINEVPETREQTLLRRAALLQLRQGQRMLYTKGPYQGLTCVIIGLHAGRLVRQNDGEDGFPMAFDARDPITDAGLICLNTIVDVVESPCCPLLNEQIMSGHGVLLAGSLGGGSSAAAAPSSTKSMGRSATGIAYSVNDTNKSSVGLGEATKNILFSKKRRDGRDGVAGAGNGDDGDAAAAAGMSAAEYLIATRGKSTAELMSVGPDVIDSYYVPSDSYLNRFCRLVNEKAATTAAIMGSAVPSAQTRFAIPTQQPFSNQSYSAAGGGTEWAGSGGGAASMSFGVSASGSMLPFAPTTADEPSSWRPLRSLFADSIVFCGHQYNCSPALMAPLNLIPGLRVRFVSCGGESHADYAKKKNKSESCRPTTAEDGCGESTVGALAAGDTRREAKDEEPDKEDVDVPFEVDELNNTAAIVLGFRSPAEGAVFPVSEWARYFASRRASRSYLARTEVYEKHFPNLLKPHSLLDKFLAEATHAQEMEQLEQNQKEREAQAEKEKSGQRGKEGADGGGQATPHTAAQRSGSTSARPLGMLSSRSGSRTLGQSTSGSRRPSALAPLLVNEYGEEVPPELREEYLMRRANSGVDQDAHLQHETDIEDAGSAAKRIAEEVNARAKEFFVVHTPIIYVYSEALGAVKAVPYDVFTGGADFQNEVMPFRAIAIGYQSGPIVVPSAPADRHDVLMAYYASSLIDKIRPPIPAAIKQIADAVLGRQENEEVANELLLNGGEGAFTDGAEGFEDDSDGGKNMYGDSSGDDDSSFGGASVSSDGIGDEEDAGAANDGSGDEEYGSVMSSPRGVLSLSTDLTPRSILKKKPGGGKRSDRETRSNAMNINLMSSKNSATEKYSLPVSVSAKKGGERAGAKSPEAAVKKKSNKKKVRRRRGGEGGGADETRKRRNKNDGGWGRSGGGSTYDFRSEARMVQSIGGGDTTSASGTNFGGGASYGYSNRGLSFAPLPRPFAHQSALGIDGGPSSAYDIGIFLCDLQAIANRFVQVGGTARIRSNPLPDAGAGPGGGGGGLPLNMTIIPKKQFSLDVRRYERTAQLFAMSELESVIAVRADDRKLLKATVGGVTHRDWLVRTISDDCGGQLRLCLRFGKTVEAGGTEVRSGSIMADSPDENTTSDETNSFEQTPSPSPFLPETTSVASSIPYLPSGALVPTPTSAASSTTTDAPLIFEVDLRAGAMFFHHGEQRDCIGRQLWAMVNNCDGLAGRSRSGVGGKEKTENASRVRSVTALPCSAIVRLLSSSATRFHRDRDEGPIKAPVAVSLISPFLAHITSSTMSSLTPNIVTAFTDCLGNPLFPGAVIMITLGVRYGRRGVVLGCGRVKEVHPSGDRPKQSQANREENNVKSEEGKANAADALDPSSKRALGGVKGQRTVAGDTRRRNLPNRPHVTHTSASNTERDTCTDITDYNESQFAPFFTPPPSPVDGCVYRCIACFDYEGGVVEVLNHTNEPFIFLENNFVQGVEMAELLATVERCQSEVKGLFSIRSTANGRMIAQNAAAMVGSLGPGGFGEGLLLGGRGGGGFGSRGGSSAGLHALGTMALTSAIGSSAALLSARSGSSSGANTARPSNLSTGSAVGSSKYEGTMDGGAAGNDVNDELYGGETHRKFWTSERDGQLLCFNTSPEATGVFGLYSLQRIEFAPRLFTVHKQILADRQASILGLSTGGLAILNAACRSLRRESQRAGDDLADLTFVSGTKRDNTKRAVEAPVPLSTTALRKQLVSSSSSAVPPLSPFPASLFAKNGSQFADAQFSNPQAYINVLAQTPNLSISNTSASLVAGHPASLRATVIGVYDRELWVLCDSTMKAVPLKGSNYLDLARNYRFAVIGIALEFPMAGIGGGGGSAVSTTVISGGGAKAGGAAGGVGIAAPSIGSLIDPLIGGDAMVFNANGLKGQSASASLTSAAGVSAAGGSSATVGASKGTNERAAASSAAQSAEAILEKLFLAARPRAFMACSCQPSSNLIKSSSPCWTPHSDPCAYLPNVTAPSESALHQPLPPPPPIDTLHGGASYLRPFLVRWPVRFARKGKDGNALLFDTDSDLPDTTAWWAAQQRLSWDVLRRTATHIHTPITTLQRNTATSRRVGTHSDNAASISSSDAVGGGGGSTMLLAILLDTREEAIRFVSNGRFGFGDRIASSSRLPTPVYRDGGWQHFGPSVLCTAVGACYGILFGIFDTSLEEEQARLDSVGLEDRKVSMFVAAPIAPLYRFEKVNGEEGNREDVSGVAAKNSSEKEVVVPTGSVTRRTSLFPPPTARVGNGPRKLAGKSLTAADNTFSPAAVSSFLKATLLRPSGIAFLLPSLTPTEVLSIVPAEFLRMPISGCNAEYHTKAIHLAMQRRREILRELAVASSNNSKSGTEDNSEAFSRGWRHTETTVADADNDGPQLEEKEGNNEQKEVTRNTGNKENESSMSFVTASSAAVPSPSRTSKLWRTLTEAKYGPLASFDGTTAYEEEQRRILTSGKGGFNNTSSDANSTTTNNENHGSSQRQSSLLGSASTPFGSDANPLVPAPLHQSLTSSTVMTQMYPETYQPFGGKTYTLADDRLVEECYQKWRAAGCPSDSREYAAFVADFIDANSNRVRVTGVGPSGLDLRHVQGLFAHYRLMISTQSVNVSRHRGGAKRGLLLDGVSEDPSALLAEIVSWILTSCGLGALQYGHTATDGMMKLLITADITLPPRSASPPSGNFGPSGNARLLPLPKWSDWQHHQTVALVYSECAQRRAMFDAANKEWSSIILDHRFRLKQILSKTFDGEEALMNAMRSRRLSQNISTRMIAVMTPSESAARNVETVLRTMSFTSTATSGSEGIDNSLRALVGGGDVKPHGGGNGGVDNNPFSGPMSLRPRSSRLPWEFPYILAKGRHVAFDISLEACQPFGAFHGQRFRCTRGDSSGAIVVIIGVLMGKLWRYREDGLTEAQPFSGTNAADIFIPHGLEVVESAEELLKKKTISAGAGRSNTNVSVRGDEDRAAYTALQHNCLGATTELEVASGFSISEIQTKKESDRPFTHPITRIPSWALSRTVCASFESPVVRTADAFLYHTLQGEVVDFDVSPKIYALLALGAVSVGTDVGLNQATSDAAAGGGGYYRAQGFYSPPSSSGGDATAPPQVRFGDRYVIGNPEALEKLCNVYEVGAAGMLKRRAAAHLINKATTAAITYANSRVSSPNGRTAPKTSTETYFVQKGGALVARSPQVRALSVAASRSPNVTALGGFSFLLECSGGGTAKVAHEAGDSTVASYLYRNYLLSDDASSAANYLLGQDQGQRQHTQAYSSPSLSPAKQRERGSGGEQCTVYDDPSPPLFGTLTVIGVREGRLWFAVDECGAQPYLGGDGSLASFFSELQLTYLYTADVESTALDFISEKRIAVFNVQKVGPAAINTSSDAMAAFGPFSHGQIVYVSNGLAGVFGGTSSSGSSAANQAQMLLNGFPTTIIGVRCGRLYHQPPDSSYCTAFEATAPQLMRTLKFTTRNERSTPIRSGGGANSTANGAANASTTYNKEGIASKKSATGSSAIGGGGRRASSSTAISAASSSSSQALPIPRPTTSGGGVKGQAKNTATVISYNIGEPLRLASAAAKYRAQHFAYPSPSGDIYFFDVSDSTCRVLFGFAHGDRVKITRPEQQAGKCVVILGVRSRQLWYIDEQLGVSAVFHGLRDHKSLMTSHGLVWVGRTAVKESIG